MSDEKAPGESARERWAVGKLLFIGDDLYEVTGIGPTSDGSRLIPVSVKKIVMTFEEEDGTGDGLS